MRGITLLLVTLLPTVAGGQEMNVCETPDMLILLDISGSMRGPKYAQARGAITQLTLALEGHVRFGLAVFPWNGSCSVEFDGGALRAAPALDNAAAIAAELEGLDPAGGTPLGVATSAGRLYLLDHSDPLRRAFLVVVTDGGESCRGTPIAAAAVAAEAGFPVFVIGFGDEADGPTLAAMAQAGGTDRYHLAHDEAELLEALSAVLVEARREVCDGRDNDCDGEIDEGLSFKPCDALCGVGRRICFNGALTECFYGPTPPEMCREDPSLDGCERDEPIRRPDGLGAPCSSDPECAPGTCLPIGSGVCTVACETAEDCLPGWDCGPIGRNRVCRCVFGTERCDGVDNDCNGLVDEGLPSALGCDPGESCLDGQCGCAGVEICDGVDNDQDGEVDERADTRCQLACHFGRLRCVDGAYAECDAAPVGDEICDGVDDDCDGRIDEDVVCPHDGRCGAEGICLERCPIGGGDCPEHFRCGADAFCHPRPCDPPCALDQRCVEEVCVQACDVDGDCPQGLVCGDDGLCGEPSLPADAGPAPPTRDAGAPADSGLGTDAGDAVAPEAGPIDGPGAEAFGRPPPEDAGGGCGCRALGRGAPATGLLAALCLILLAATPSRRRAVVRRRMIGFLSAPGRGIGRRRPAGPRCAHQANRPRMRGRRQTPGRRA